MTPWTVARLFCPWNSPGKNIVMGCHSLLQGIFPTKGLNLHLLHCRQTLYCLSHQGSPLETCAYIQKGEKKKKLGESPLPREYLFAMQSKGFSSSFPLFFLSQLSYLHLPCPEKKRTDAPATAPPHRCSEFHSSGVPLLWFNPACAGASWEAGPAMVLCEQQSVL